MAKRIDPASAESGKYAHTKDGLPPSDWHLVRVHLEAVARLAGNFADRFKSREWGVLAGLWHDVGKYSVAFQDYLRASSSHDPSAVATRTDHKSAGAQHAAEAVPVLGHLLAYVIAGHHGGLPDGRSDGPSLEMLLSRKVEPWNYGLRHLSRTPPTPSAHLWKALGQRDAFAAAFFTRMLFSCLVDADFLDTEQFKDPERSHARPQWPADILLRMEAALDAFVEGLYGNAAAVDGHRSRVREACLAAATEVPGFFSLTVPTGGGKTLSSLAFALRHARRHGLERVIYVVPFTSIIEQNADVFREAMKKVSAGLGQDVVLEHHCNLDIDKRETPASRLATENWDAPLIVTTSVQFYDSLFHNRPSRCRKLHRIAKSVVVLDEVQTLPVHLLEPCLQALKELVQGYGTTVVLCTATQPALHFRADFAIGLKGVREIIPDPATLAQDLERVHVENLGKREDSVIAARILQENQVLCIVNTREHARRLFTAIGEGEGHYHLSALMIPVHRSRVIGQAQLRLERGQPCRIVATRVVEAGVDIDFPTVYRSLAGLDSIGQAAGRCNRNGKIKAGGRAFIFRSTHSQSERFLKDSQEAARQVLSLHEDPLSLEAIERYFKLYFWDQSARWDEKRILQSFALAPGSPGFPFLFNFATCARDFHLIEDKGRAVIVPWDDEGRALCERLRFAGPLPPRDVLRRLQRYTVQIPNFLWERHLNRGIELMHDRYALLTSPEVHYLDSIGLNLDDPEVGSLVI